LLSSQPEGVYLSAVYFRYSSEDNMY